MPVKSAADLLLTTWLERDVVPDAAIRVGIRRLLKARLNEQEAAGSLAQEQFIAGLRNSPIAIRTDAANQQHYEVPAEFYQRVLGPHMKYSCALWTEETADFAQAEAGMLALTCERARLQNGQDVLELGCGWGSLSLWMAEHYPQSRIVAVSNSHSQKQFIDAQAAQRGLRNLQILTADITEFATDLRFDRVVSVEMFEHMRNYAELLRRIATWSRPGACLFVHVFSHRRFAYPFEVRDSTDWMAQYFFTGGLMPSRDLLPQFKGDWHCEGQWQVGGVHYQKTSEAWLARVDQNREQILAVFANTYGPKDALRWLVRWRTFFMACAELFGYAGGEEWGVSHYLFRKPPDPARKLKI